MEEEQKKNTEQEEQKEAKSTLDEENKKEAESIPEEENEEEEKTPKKKAKKFTTKKIHHHIKKVGQDPWKVISGALTILLLIIMFSGGGESKISAESAEEKAIEYISQNLVRQGTEVTSEGVEETEKLYRVKLNIAGNNFDSYVTKDGSMLFPTAYDLNAEVEKTEQEQPPAEEVTKSDKPKVELFVMSFCPYGNKAEDTMYPVYKLLKDKVDWQIRYIVSVSGDTVRSLHGQPETDQNIREVCVKKYDGLDKFWEFVTYVNTNCGRAGECWEEAAKAVGTNIEKLKTCFADEGLELMKEEAAAASAAGASGSPTMLINGQKSSSVYRYGQSEQYKATICSAFNEAPEECEGALANTETTEGGSC